MDVNYLLKDELEFELASRGVYIKSVVPVMKKLLKELMISEEKGDYSYQIKAPRQSFENPATELDACKTKIIVLESYVSEISEKPDRYLFRRLVSRLYHIKNRIDFIVPDSDKTTECRENYRIKVDNLLAQLEKQDDLADEEVDLTLDDKRILQETLGAVAEKIIKKFEKESYSGENSKEVSRHDVNINKPVDFEENLASSKLISTNILSRKLTRSSTVLEEDTFNHKRKLVPIDQWGVKFSGNNNKISVNAFIERVQELKDARNASDKDLWRYAIDFFDGDALIWYRANRENIFSWKELTLLLKRTFEPPCYQEELLDEIRSRTQGQNESAIIYISIMQNMFNRLPEKILEQKKIMMILKNLQPYFQRALCRDYLSSMADLENVLRIVKRTKISCEKFQEPRSGKNTLEPDLAYKMEEIKEVKMIDNHVMEIKSSMVGEVDGKRCWNCRETGHLFRLCTFPKQRLFCYRCGRFGITSKDCSCKGNGSGEGNKSAK